MSNQNGSYNWGSGDNQWNTPSEPQPTQQFPQQNYNPQYAQPQYAQPNQYPGGYPGGFQQQEKRSNVGWIVALAVLLLAIPVAIYAFMNVSGAFNGGSGPVTNTIVETSTRGAGDDDSAVGGEKSDDDKDDNKKDSDEPTASSSEKSSTKKAPEKRSYGNWSPDTDVTSSSFASNVYDAFVSAYNRGGDPNVTITAWSPVTGVEYRMTCRGDKTVYCTGGNNARVKIW